MYKVLALVVLLCALGVCLAATSYNNGYYTTYQNDDYYGNGYYTDRYYPRDGYYSNDRYYNNRYNNNGYYNDGYYSRGKYYPQGGYVDYYPRYPSGRKSGLGFSGSIGIGKTGVGGSVSFGHGGYTKPYYYY